MMLSKQSLDDSLFDDDFTWDEYKPSPTTNITTEKPLTNICQSGCFDEYAKYADFDDSFEMTPEEQQRMTQVLKDMENSNNTS